MCLARIAHHPATADADQLAVTGRAPCSHLDVVSATSAASFSPRAPSQRRLDALATNGAEQSGLARASFLRTIAATFLLLIMPAGSAQDLTLATVLENYRQAIGGDDAIAQVRSVFIQGRTLATKNTAEMPFKAWYEPDKNHLRLEYLYLGVPGVVSFDGEHGWNVLPVISNRQAMPMQGADLLQIREQADFFGPLIQPDTKHVALRLLAPETTSEGRLQRIEVTRSFSLPAADATSENGSEDAAADKTTAQAVEEVSIWKLSSSSWLPQMVVSADRLDDGSSRTLTVRYSDYRRVATAEEEVSIVWPHRVATDDGSGEPQINVLDEISLNVPMDQVKFDLSVDPR